MPAEKTASTTLPNDTRTAPLHQQIATQAYILWEHYGRPRGRDDSIWLEAEKQVLGVDPQVNPQPGGGVAARPLGEALISQQMATPDAAVVVTRRKST